MSVRGLAVRSLNGGGDEERERERVSVFPRAALWEAM